MLLVPSLLISFRNTFIIKAMFWDVLAVNPAVYLTLTTLQRSEEGHKWHWRSDSRLPFISVSRGSSFRHGRVMSLFTFAASLGCFKSADSSAGVAGAAGNTPGGGAANSQARGLVKATKSRSEVEGIRRAESEDGCNFMAPLAASETLVGAERRLVAT